jgi:hypothetical protein
MNRIRKFLSLFLAAVSLSNLNAMESKSSLQSSQLSKEEKGQIHLSIDLYQPDGRKYMRFGVGSFSLDASIEEVLSGSSEAVVVHTCGQAVLQLDSLEILTSWFWVQKFKSEESMLEHREKLLSTWAEPEQTIYLKGKLSKNLLPPQKSCVVQ